ncbi:MAG: DUF3127 domain-containing protein [Prevotellaceae bacterium]|jgi:hypothetical protein|nr:DUF3127 domain-containing protein [Prevotellaceae bacterium]
MALDITGKLIQKLDIQSGESSYGSWKRQDAIIETVEQYPKKICVLFRNDKITELEKLNLGDMLTISVNIESREWNAKWFTSVIAWRVQLADASANTNQQNTAAPQQPVNVHQNAPAPTSGDFIDAQTEPETEIDDLPF